MLFSCHRVSARALFSLAVAVATVASASARPINQVVVFGDSLSDNGNTSALAGGAFPVAPYAPGRLSNGAVWAEGFASALGVPLVDRAFAGAYTDARNTASGFIPNAPGMQTVLNSYLASNPVLDANSLYVVWGGANDLFNDQASAAAGVPAQNIRNQVNQLIGAGAKNLLVLNLPSLGNTPGGAASGFGTQLNALTNLHNATLASNLATLSAANPTVAIRTLDINALLNQVQATPSAFGFTNATSPYVINNGPSGVNPTVVGTGSANNYVFWDEIHPTAAVHSIIAQRAVAAVVPEGGTAGLVLAGASLLGAGVVVRRRK